MRRSGRRVGGWRVAVLLLVLVAPLLLGACGRKGWPQPAGPADQVTYPRPYPAR